MRPRRRPATPVTWVFLALCVAVTLAGMIRPGSREVLGGLKPLHSPWQRLTLAFQHGYGGLPPWLHLGLNAILLLRVGRAAERLLGSARFAALTVAAMGGFAVAHLCPRVDGHGSSGVIWAYAPVVFVAIRSGDGPGRKGLVALLAVMWIVVTPAMAAVAYAGGFRGNPLMALVLGNLFHVAASVVGIAAAFAWRDRIAAAWRQGGA